MLHKPQTTLAFTKIIAACMLLVAASCKQPGEAPPYRPDKPDTNPSFAFLTPEESMKTMHLPEGYHLELVASEPMVQEPVAVVWDANGKMYVAEMRSYMQDINGTGEHLPVCRISLLEDTNGDGKMDKHSVFIDSLVLPRMMLPLDDKLVVSETYTYNLYSYRDSNGDGVADEKTMVFHNDAPDNANLEHQKSGLIWNIDNYIYVTYNPVRYRYDNGMLVADSLNDSPGGQWGLTSDDYGRLFYSSAGGEEPAVNFQQNPKYGRLDFDDQRIADFDSVYPIIITPDVQGGADRLRKDSTLNHFTASCGQTVYRGDKLPATMRGDLFICEPVGRLIRRAKVINKDGETFVKNAYDKAEFLTSSDMNFRPVNTSTGPDGCMYIVDMYHGIIQESAWTKEGSYLRPQIQRKNLDKNIGRGRIYRLVHDGYKPGPKPNLLKAGSDELVKTLSNANGWWRDNAQRLLVIRGDKSVTPQLESLVLSNDAALYTRLHALWTLDGLHALSPQLLQKMFTDKAPEMRCAAIRITEPLLAKGDSTLLTQLEPLKNDTTADVKIQLALSLRFSKTAQAKALLNELATNNKANKFVVHATTKSLEEGDEALNKLRADIAYMPWRDRKLVMDGALNFRQLCATCHGPEGKGLPSKVAPPLAGSARVNGNMDVVIRILLNGLQGPVDNKKYPDVMPAQGANEDDYIAEVLSYIRNSMGNKASVVHRDDIRRVRKEVGDRNTSWTLDELNKVKNSVETKGL
ncbi:c-type cytochrome [Danxiaibacter flavus]|uniref:C-type cytochrome n=1 Tax=Danxiaibacter flavus TaxID=3049108 RepID=A0ABV3ZP24_9BACT|nr:c-type cytochrome [Chitinophagaceae bacterium DXS]